MQAIVISDASETRYRQYGEAMIKYLVGRPSVSRIMACRDVPHPLDLAPLFAEAGDQPLLLCYYGHGSIIGWADGDRTSYEQLASLIGGRTAPTMVVNSTCHSGALLDRLEEAGVDPRLVGALVSTDAEHKSHGRMATTVLDSWSQGRPYRPLCETIKVEFGGTVTEPMVKQTRLPDGTVQIRLLPSPWPIRLWNQVRIQWYHLHPQVLHYYERRWGAEWDHLFFT